MKLPGPCIPRKVMYLSAGNFPSRAANTIQVAKMAAAYKRLLPSLEVVTLSGIRERPEHHSAEIQRWYGLGSDLPVRSLPFRPQQKSLFFDEEYRPPRWFYSAAAFYAKWQGADLVFTRKAETAYVTVRLGIDTILEIHIPPSMVPNEKIFSVLRNSSHLKALVVVADSLRDQYLHLGFSEETIVLEHDGVDLQQYHSLPEKREIRAKLGLPLTRNICIYTGHLYRDRGIETLLEAAGGLPEVQFLLVGGWESDITWYRNLSDTMKLSNVSFLGFKKQSEIPLYQAAADVLVMQYSDKTAHANRCSPLKLFEYMASGSPIVSTDLSTLSGILRHRENCLLTPPDSPEYLTSSILELLENRELAQSLASSAKKTVEYFSWDARACRVLDNARISVAWRNEVHS